MLAAKMTKCSGLQLLFRRGGGLCNSGNKQTRLLFSTDTKRQREFKLNVDSNYVIRSPSEDIPLAKRTLYEQMWEGPAAKKWPDRTAIEDAITGHGFTFASGRAASRRLAKALQDLSISKGDVSCVFLPNCPEYAVTVGGAALAGAVSSTMNPAFTPGEVARQLDLAKPRFLFCETSAVDTLVQARERTNEKGPPLTAISIDAKEHQKRQGFDVLSLEKLLAEANGEPSPVQIDVDNDLAALPFSSGTTGVPKGVMLTHGNLVYNSQQIGDSKVFDYRIPASDTHQSSTVNVLPMYHIYAFNGLMVTCLRHGERLATLTKFVPDTYIDAIKKHKPTFLAAAPPLVQFMAYSDKLASEDLKEVRYFVVAAAPCGESIMSKMRTKMPDVMFVEGYGLTETGPAATISPYGYNVPNSCGQVLANTQLKVVDIKTGETLEPGKKGEICIKGPQVMKGYLGNEAATKDCLKEDGWFHSGDLGHFDTEGNLFVSDRLKELIKVKGLQVPPAELEDVLRSHPAVADVAVIGVPHERFGEAPRAYIVVKDGSKLDEKEVMDFMTEEVSEYKRLAGGIAFVKAGGIPKSPAGKILRRELKDKYLEENK